tara:strand:+ start:759 stop:1256 length:498 start_codon:yes stop_codon:yes gene_type:complete
MVFNKKEWSKQNYLDNKERLKNCPNRIAYLKSVNRKKTSLLCGWKTPPKSGGFGLITDNINYVWNKYLNSTNCERCNVKFGEFHNSEGSWKTMHHDHNSNSENFRNILCHRCNMQIDSKNIYYDGNRYHYSRQDFGIRHRKSSKCYYKIVIYKWLYEAGYAIETN